MVIIIFNRGKTRQKFSPDFDNTPFPDINTRVKTLLPWVKAQKNGGLNGYRNSEVVQ
jgi:hypothetical protein